MEVACLGFVYKLKYWVSTDTFLHFRLGLGSSSSLAFFGILKPDSEVTDLTAAVKPALRAVSRAGSWIHPLLPSEAVACSPVLADASSIDSDRDGILVDTPVSPIAEENLIQSV